MKSRATLLMLLACVLLGSSGCQGESNLEDSSLQAGRISVAEAEALVRAKMLREKPDMNPAAQFPLEEVTTDEIWQRLHIQIFRLDSDFLGPETYAIANEQIDVLGASFGGHGVTHMYVTDLDSDDVPELTYTYSFGSGLHRSHIAVYLPSQTGSGNIVADTVYWGGDLVLEKVDDQNVIVKVGYYDPQQDAFVAQTPIGQVFLKPRGGQLELVVELHGDLPPEITEWLSAP